MEIKDILKSRRIELRLTQDDIANKIGVSKATVSRWESGNISNMRRDRIAKLAEILQISPAVIIGIKDTNVTPVINVLSHKYSYLDAPISAGTPETFDDVYELPTISVADCFLGRYAGNKDVVIMRVNGESMNRIIPDKSIIAVKRNVDINSIHDGDIVVVYINGSNCGYTVKHFYRDTKKDIIILRPDSTCTSFTDITVNKENDDSLYLIGKVIAYNVIL